MHSSNTINCPDCGDHQWSIADRNYVRLYGTGWCCDKKRWEDGELPIHVFEEREKVAAQTDPSTL
jgi:hypothetical protein